jgi:hypothetical protein
LFLDARPERNPVRVRLMEVGEVRQPSEILTITFEMRNFTYIIHLCQSVVE